MFTETIDGYTLHFETSPSLFSPGKIDAGTRAMLSAAVLLPDDKLLDLGCGFGPVGIYAAQKIGAGKVVMCDILPEAVSVSRRNAEINGVSEVQILQSDGLREIADRDFTMILSNPPYHTDFAVAKHFIEDGFRHLRVGGRLLMVTKRLEWYKNKLAAVFGGVRVKEIDGYYVFLAEKRTAQPPVRQKKPQRHSRKLERSLRRSSVLPAAARKQK